MFRFALVISLLAMSCLGSCRNKAPAPLSGGKDKRPSASKAVRETAAAGETEAAKGHATSSPTRVTVSGYELEVSLVPEQNTFMVGEPVFVVFMVKNLSKEKLQLPEGGDYRNRMGRPNRYKVSVKPMGGAGLPVKDSGPSFGGITGNRPIPPGSTFRRELFLPDWVDLEKPGVYEISATRPLEIERYQAGQAPSMNAKGPNVTVGAKVTVTPSDPKKMGRIIDGLGEKLMGSSSDLAERASKALHSITDPRTIPWWLKALKTKGYSLKFQAIRALGRYSTEEAFGGLKLCIEDQDTNIRQTCAHSLSVSRHPDALSTLLSMRKDSYQGVRITVLHALGKMPCSRSRKLIQSMTKDKSNLVRDEAQRYLKMCTAKKD